MCVLIFYMSGVTYSLETTPNDKFLRNLSWQFYLLSEFITKSAERKSLKSFPLNQFRSKLRQPRPRNKLKTKFVFQNKKGNQSIKTFELNCKIFYKKIKIIIRAPDSNCRNTHASPILGDFF